MRAKTKFGIVFDTLICGGITLLLLAPLVNWGNPPEQTKEEREVISQMMCIAGVGPCEEVAAPVALQ